MNEKKRDHWLWEIDQLEHRNRRIDRYLKRVVPTISSGDPPPSVVAIVTERKKNELKINQLCNQLKPTKKPFRSCIVPAFGVVLFAASLSILIYSILINY